jgi:hypothetical protein
MYARDAVDQRFRLAHRYLRRWNDESLPLFDNYVKMSQFGGLWRIFTGGHLQKLLERDYPDTNLPWQVKTRLDRVGNLNDHLERNYMFVGVVYRKRMTDEMPGVFRNPVARDSQAYAQAMVFVPRRRLIKAWVGPRGIITPGSGPPVTGVPGQGLGVPGPPSVLGLPPPPAPPPPPPTPPGSDEEVEEYRAVILRQDARYHPEHWTLINQNWTAQLVPATCRKIPSILSDQPYGLDMPQFDTPDLTEIESDDFLWLSNH